VLFRRHRIEYHYDETIEALVQILINFLKALRFHHHQSILAAPQLESLPRIRPLQAAEPLQNRFAARALSITASRWTLAKSLRSQSTPQNQETIFAFVLADQFIQTKVREWKNWNFKNKNLWKQFQDDFEEWTKTTFKKATINVLRALQAYLRERDVWVMKHKRKTIAKSLYDVLQKETKTSWTEEEIKRCILTEHFTFNRIERLLKIEFNRKSKNYSWQAKRRLSRKESSAREQSVKKPSLSSLERQSPSSRFPKFF
jgi:AAA+ ATPase superfamily predicted ATPase